MPTFSSCSQLLNQGQSSKICLQLRQYFIVVGMLPIRLTGVQLLRKRKHISKLLYYICALSQAYIIDIHAAQENDIRGRLQTGWRVIQQLSRQLHLWQEEMVQGRVAVVKENQRSKEKEGKNEQSETNKKKIVI